MLATWRSWDTLQVPTLFAHSDTLWFLSYLVPILWRLIHILLVTMFNWGREKDLEHTSNSEDCEGLLSASERSSIDTQLRPVSREHSWLTTTIIVGFTAIISALSGAWIVQTSRLDADSFSIRHTSQYSPIIDDVAITYSLVRFNGSLMRSNVFRQDAGPEVDAAWKSLGADFHAVSIPLDRAAKSGFAEDQVKIKKEYGGGYPANVEGLHHLHCLNLLRKSLAWNIEYYRRQGLGPFSNSEDILKYHTTHCLDILRQQLMCTVDVGVLGQVWYQPHNQPPEAFVDFNTVHKCRNFEAIRNWADKHQLPASEDTPLDFLERPKAGDRIWHTVP
ncbi:hypothetical protein BS50DRAFT_563171 [Corynespora cassiicola Philippines]|uniref:Tat pathway signal sequence n=1 Tax=Corynespora cassiicola Philippines TaxID=1448308 RepID=A0A2T2N6I4_CORCC|nr:hypothetical protein BS50DRAFT_563171 [Corynespora cassiicola Philippines]